MYCIPYGALTPELGKTSDDWVFIATCNSIAWALAFAFSQSIWALKGDLESMGFDAMTAIRMCAIFFYIVGALTILLTSLVFPSLLIVGSASGTPNATGASITVIVGGGLCLLVALVLKFYDEDRVNQFLNDVPDRQDDGEGLRGSFDYS